MNHQNSYLGRLHKLLLMTTVGEEDIHKPPKSDFLVFNEEVHTEPDEIDLGFDFGPWNRPGLRDLIHRNRNHDESEGKEA